jgi:UPF0271 protein
VAAKAIQVSSVDLNADLGEGAGPGLSAMDTELLGLVTSANIACGAHAGNPGVMRATVIEAARRGVAIGAHPGYPDRAGFGRRELNLSPAEVATLVVEQVVALLATCASAGARLSYVKPHGALYNRAVRDDALARAVAGAIREVDETLILLGGSGSALLSMGKESGLRVASEAFLDRAYRPDGTLVPRGEPGAVLHDVAAIAERGVLMMRDGMVLASDGTRVRIHAESLCVHGDNPDAAASLRAVRARFEREGVTIAPFALR